MTIRSDILKELIREMDKEFSSVVDIKEIEKAELLCKTIDRNIWDKLPISAQFLLREHGFDVK